MVQDSGNRSHGAGIPMFPKETQTWQEFLIVFGSLLCWVDFSWPWGHDFAHLNIAECFLSLFT